MTGPELRRFLDQSREQEIADLRGAVENWKRLHAEQAIEIAGLRAALRYANYPQPLGEYPDLPQTAASLSPPRQV